MGECSTILSLCEHVRPPCDRVGWIGCSFCFQPWRSADKHVVATPVDHNPPSLCLPHQPPSLRKSDHNSVMSSLSVLATLQNANAMSPRRQKYSVYLPLHRPSRATSRAASAAKEGGGRSPKPTDRKSTRNAAHAASSKRRSTMNSRDAAYDEEQLRRAIEISKEESIREEPDGTLRRPKRVRDDDDEYVPPSSRVDWHD